MEFLGHTVVQFFNYLRNLSPCFHSGCTSLHTHQQRTSVPFSPCPHQHLLFVLLIFFFAYFKGLFTQSSPTLCDPMDCGPPGSSVHGILQARRLEWVAISYSIFVLFLMTAILASLKCHFIVVLTAFHWLLAMSRTCHCLWPSAYPFWKKKKSIQSSCFCDIEFYDCPYMLDIDALLVISLTNIFSHSVHFLFILWIVSFAVQKLVSLIRSCLFLLSYHLF